MCATNANNRCSHSQVTLGPAILANQNQRTFSRFGDNGSSRSSVSSHSSSVQHHHHNSNHGTVNNSNGTISFPSMCAHQAHLNYVCHGHTIQHDHLNSSLSDHGSCLNHNPGSRGFVQFPCGGCCASNNVHHLHRCQSQLVNADIRSSNSNGGATSTISRNTLFLNENMSSNTINNGCNNNDPHRSHISNQHSQHTHHHNDFHNIQLSSSSSLSSLQPVDPNNSSSFHRCNQSQLNAPPLISQNLASSQVPRGSVTSHCNHLNRSNSCGCHHQTNHCSNHVPGTTIAQHQTIHTGYSNCLLTHNEAVHHVCNTTGKACSSPTSSNLHHRYQQELLTNQSSEASHNDSLPSTAHTHNLSNSSTTTHTSNVAVKHQPQFQRSIQSRGPRSTSSQQYEQYGPSSAASTSSATASLSNYFSQSGYESDLPPLFLPNKMQQPLPPPPLKAVPEPKARPHTPVQINFNSNQNVNTSNNIPIMATTFLSPPIPPQSAQQSYNQSTTLPPLPKKRISPNASSTSAATITTARVETNLANESNTHLVTRLTSQAGVQNPLPNSDTPPPLPPLNPGSRNQPLITGIQNEASGTPVADLIPNFSNLNLRRVNNGGGGILTDAERKTEALTRQIELELEQQLKSGEPYGICPKCSSNVMPAQEACKALNQIYHATCFVCCQCNRTLLGKTFYPVGDKVYCEEDFKVSILLLDPSRKQSDKIN